MYCLLYCLDATKSNEGFDQFSNKIAKLVEITDDKKFSAYMAVANLMYNHRRAELISILEIRKEVLLSKLNESLPLLKNLREELDATIKAMNEK
jgi:hypothetical protein